MGGASAWQQLRASLWKDLLRRKRKPVSIGLEVGWPVFIFTFVILVRQGSLPQPKDTCRYRPWLLPSSGGLRYLQNFLCNLNNNCRKNLTDTAENPKFVEVTDAYTQLQTDDLSDILKLLPKGGALVQLIDSKLSHTGIFKFLDLNWSKVHVHELLSNKAAMLSTLTHGVGLTSHTANALLHANTNFNQEPLSGMALSLYYSIISCDPDLIMRLVRFRQSRVDPKEVFDAVCKLQKSLLPDTIRMLEDDVTMNAFLHMIFRGVKELKYSSPGSVSDLVRIVDNILRSSILERAFTQTQELSFMPFFINDMTTFIQQSVTQLVDFKNYTTFMQNVFPTVDEWWDTANLIRDFADVTDSFNGFTGAILSETSQPMNSTWEYFAEVFGLPPDIIEFMINTQINNTKVENLKKMLQSDVDSFSIVCIEQIFTEIFVTNETAVLDMMESILCDKNQTSDNVLLRVFTNLYLFGDHKDVYNTSLVVEDIPEVVDSVDAIISHLTPTVNDLINIILSQNDISIFYKILTQSFSSFQHKVQQVLELFDARWSTLLRTHPRINKVYDELRNMWKSCEDLADMTVKLLTSAPTMFHSIATDVIEKDIILKLETDDLYHRLCNGSTGGFTLPGVDTEKLATAVCAASPNQTYYNFLQWLPVETWVRDQIHILFNGTESDVWFWRRTLQDVQIIYDIITFWIGRENATNSRHALTNIFTHIFNSDGIFAGMARDIRAGLPRDVSITRFLADLEDLVDYIVKLDLLNTGINLNRRIGDILASTRDLTRVLAKRAGLNPEIVDAILRASFDTIINLNSMGLFGVPCSADQLSSLFIFPDGTNVEMVASELCSLTLQDMAEILKQLLIDTNIADILEQLLSLTPDLVLGATNLTKTELNNFMDVFPAIVNDFNNLMNKLSFVKGQLLQTESENSKITFGGIDVEGLATAVCGEMSDMDLTQGSGLAALLGDEGGISGENKKTQRLEEIHASVYHQKEIEELGDEFCINIYEQLQTSFEVGPILWWALKPMFRGHIMYSPKTQATRIIMNEVFSLVDAIKSMPVIADGWLQALSSFTNMVDTNTTVDLTHFRDLLHYPVIEQTVSGMLGIDAGFLARQLALVDLDGTITLGGDDINHLQQAALLIANFSRCFNVTVTGVNTEEDMVEMSEHYLNDNSLLAGVVFLDMEDSEDNRESGSSGVPRHVQYKIRMSPESIPRTDGIVAGWWSPGPASSVLENLRYLRGFLPVQDLVEQGILKHHIESPTPHVTLHQFPFPCWKKDFFQLFGGYIVCIILVFTWMVLVATGINNLLMDKEKGINMTLEVMGLKPWVGWLSWFIDTFLGMCFLSALVTGFLKLGQLASFANVWLLYILLVSYSYATTMMSYAISVFFHRSTLATMCSLIIYLLACLPFIVVYNMEFSGIVHLWQKLLVSTVAPSAFCYGSLFTMDKELRAEGIQWSNMAGNMSEYNFLWCIIMLCLDGTLYGLLGWYVSNIKPGLHQSPKPWNFPFTKTFWCGGFYKPQIDEEDTEPIEQAPGEDEPADLEVGIRLQKLTKVYAKGAKPAVNDLTVQFYQGQVTAFLGHNGAGKTSTIHMMTGVFPATSGKTYVNGNDVSTDLQRIRARGHVGFCPQYEILFDFMTVREHIAFYLSIKSNSSAEASITQTRQMLEWTGLERCMQMEAKHLSGGQKRRLAVGLAFIGGSKTIILDEPTSGVDPAARRNIWDIIAKHREGRTILLSTHDLDEAEIIGDRIVIIHQGRLICHGSPIFLKTTYGRGYHLTIAKAKRYKYNKSKRHAQDKQGCEASKVLRFIRLFVPSAEVVEEFGSEMTCVLPSVNNSHIALKELFRQMDKNLAALRIHKYGISDTTLEEVFLRVTECAENGVPIIDAKKIDSSGEDTSSITPPSSTGAEITEDMVLQALDDALSVGDIENNSSAGRTVVTIETDSRSRSTRSGHGSGSSQTGDSVSGSGHTGPTQSHSDSNSNSDSRSLHSTDSGSRSTQSKDSRPKSSGSGDAGSSSNGGQEDSQSSHSNDNSSSSTHSGNTGDTSSTGNTGDSGSTGNRGDISSTGNTDDSSSTGNRGDISSTGNTGDNSSTGNTGDNSSTGNTDDNSSTGNTGDSSSTGNTGDTRSTRNTGEASFTGNTGDTSSTGNTTGKSIRTSLTESDSYSRNDRGTRTGSSGQDTDSISTRSDKSLLNPDNNSVSSFSGTSSEKKDSENNRQLNDTSLRGKYQITGVYLKIRQFWALLVKRFHHHRRNRQFYMSQVLFPGLFVVIAMACVLLRPTMGNLPALLLHPAMYGPNSTLLIKNDAYLLSLDTRGQALSESLRVDGPSGVCMSQSALRDTCQPPVMATSPAFHAEVNVSQFGHCDCGDGYQRCDKGAAGPQTDYFYLRTGDLVMDLTYNPFTIEEYLLRTEEQFSSISPAGIRGRYGGWSFGEINSPAHDNSSATVWFQAKALHILPALYNGLSNMFLRANVHPDDRHQYGITVYNHPFKTRYEQLSLANIFSQISDTGVSLLMLAALCFVPPGYTTYLIGERVNKEKRLQFLCGVGTTLYWLTTFMWDMLNYCMSMLLIVLVTWLFAVPMFTAMNKLYIFIALLLAFGWATIPIMYLVLRWFKNVGLSYLVLFIINLFLGINCTAITFFLSLPVFSSRGVIKTTRDLLSKAMLIFPQYCMGDGFMKLAKSQVVFDVYNRFGLDRHVDPFSPDMLLWHIVVMAVEGTVFLVIVIVLESKFLVIMSGAKPRSRYEPEEDTDVRAERQRVETGAAKADTLILYKMGKIYRKGFQKLSAVNNLCLGIPKGECFGLLGINGAGKTTTFKMITGDITPSTGAAILNGKVISDDESNMDQNVGYCPQNDGIDSMLTGRETVYFYARLKGIPERDIPRICAAIETKFELSPHIDKLVGVYSGGNKRKLSTAIALLGDPDLVLLDEPTTGMDPGSRRLVWNNIIQVVKDKRSVILTSHSMAECDALCTRLAIMVNGRFTCLGTGQHLKNKFGSGYTVILRVGGDPSNVNTEMSFMFATFPGTILKDQHLRLLEFEVSTRTASLATVFGELEKRKLNGHIDDYSVTQTTLDQVFLNFARHQHDGRLEEDSDSIGDTDFESNLSLDSSNSFTSLLTGTSTLRRRTNVDNEIKSYMSTITPPSGPRHYPTWSHGTVPPITRRFVEDQLLKSRHYSLTSRTSVFPDPTIRWAPRLTPSYKSAISEQTKTKANSKEKLLPIQRIFQNEASPSQSDSH